MDYDVIVATRNRPGVLGLTIPSFLGQRPRPRRLVVVDSSDDHGPTRAAVQQAAAAFGPERAGGGDDRGGPPVELTILHTEPGSSRQRNLGLRHAAAPVVMFPDDDAIWFDGAARAAMQIYERDTDGLIGGVSFHESRRPPEGVLSGDEIAAGHGSLSQRLIYRLSPVRAWVEDRLTPNPMHWLGEALLRERAVPPWLAEAGAHPVPYMLGFRMSFRRESILRRGFDEGLTAYGLYEDHEASLGVLAGGQALVMSDRSLVYHHRAPGARAPGRRTGAILLLNMAYVTCRHSEPGSPARGKIRAYAKTRLAQYRLRAGGEFGRDRLAGAEAAAGQLDRLIAAPTDELPAAYTAAIDACLGGGLSA